MVIPLGPSEVDAEVFSRTLCPLPALVFGGGRVLASDLPAPASSFPPLGGGDAPVVLPIPWRQQRRCPPWLQVFRILRALVNRRLGFRMW
jgi:hypothetical protein